MACYHPLTGLWYGENWPDSGKKKYLIISQEEKVKFISSKAFVRPLEQIEVPCGKCVGCRLEYSRQWANRCMLEAQQYENNAFITLTYSDKNAKWVIGANRETGEVEPVTTLVPEHLTKFMKDLRRYYEYHYNHNGIRFYACGEYGSQTHRAHFHLIIFNLPIYDKEKFFINKSGEQIYLSKTIDKIWEKGLTSVGDVTWNSAAYVARYVMKKIKGPEAEETYKKLGIVPEFVRMSRKPGIAWQYFKDNKDAIYECDEIIITGKKGVAEKIKPCKYYDRLFDLDSPEAMQSIKEQRRAMAEEAECIRLEKTSLTKREYLDMKEQAYIEKVKKLKRTI